MMLRSWPVRSLFKYVFKRVLGTFIKNDINLDEIDFSGTSFSINDIEMNTYEINNLISSDSSNPPALKLISMSVKSIEIPWKLIGFSWGDVKVHGVQIMLMPSPAKGSGGKKEDKDEVDGTKEEEESKEMFSSEVSLSSSLVTKFLSNIGFTITDIAVKVLPCEFGCEPDDFDTIPTMMMRLKSISLQKQINETNKAEETPEQAPEVENLEESTDTQSDTSVIERPLPTTVNILKNKEVKVGQISIHLMPSALETDVFTSPPIRHLSTLV